MKTSKRFFAWLGAFGLACAVGCSSSSTPSQGPNSSLPELKRGGNLTGWFQFGTFQESRFGELQRMSELGVDFIRLPIEPTRFYDRNSPDWALLDRVLTEAGRVNIKVIVDLHPAYNTQRLALTGDERYPKLLEDLARYLPKFGTDKVLLELMNEPISPVGDSCDKNFDWNSWQRKFYDAARVGSKDITIVLTGACWGGVDGLLAVQPIQDARVIYSIHNYDQMEFTHQGAGWTSSSLWYLRGMPYPASPERVEQTLPAILYNVPTSAMKSQYRYGLQAYGKSGFGRATMERTLGKARDWAKQNNARLLLGEYGVLITDALPQDRVAWIRDMRETAESMGMAHAIWDFSSQGSFGPYRGGKLEAGALEAMGLNVPTDAIATPANPSVDSSLPINPVLGDSALIADFAAGSQNLSNSKTTYFAYGQPAQPTFTAAGAGNTAPFNNGQLEFDYDIPLNNDWGGVTAVVPAGDGSALDATAFTHIRLELAEQKVTQQGSEVRVALASRSVDTGGDHPQVSVEVGATRTAFTIPLSAFRQAGWGKAVDVGQVLKNLHNIEVTALEQGKAGRLIIDDIALVTITDASRPSPITSDKTLLLYNFELENNAGNAGGAWYVSRYQQNPNAPVTGSSSVVMADSNQQVQMNFDITSGNDWAGSILGMPFTSPKNALEYAALRFDASATGTQLVRVELNTSLDVGGDHPQMYLTLSPDIKTYRIPITEFAQAGWGKAVDLREALSKFVGVSLNVDTVGVKGTLKVDNVILEKK
jgi:endoglucanase